MINLEQRLTVDDLIVEYMIYKVQNGYEPSFPISEFTNFMTYFESKMKVDDILPDGEQLFLRFFERKGKQDWKNSSNQVIPHMDITYSETYNDYLISANYKLSDYDKSIINTYFMDNGLGKFNQGKVVKIRSIIGEYLSHQEKRKIGDNMEFTADELKTGKFIAAQIIKSIWENYINELIDEHKWPKQCKDINKFLFQIDLASIIEVKSIKKELFELYSVLSKRIAIMYNKDKRLQISTLNHAYLARSNFEILVQGYEKIIQTAFGEHKKSFSIDLSTKMFTVTYIRDGVYFWDEAPEIKTVTTELENDNIKKLVLNLES